MNRNDDKWKTQGSIEKSPPNSGEDDGFYRDGETKQEISLPERGISRTALQEIAAAQAMGPLVSSLASMGLAGAGVMTGAETLVSSLASSLGTVSNMVTAAMPMAVSGVSTSGMVESLNGLAAATASCQNIGMRNSGINAVLNLAIKTPELLKLQEQITACGPMADGLSAIGSFVSNLSSTWQSSMGMTDMAARSMEAQNIAFLRLTRNYRDMKLPRGGKTVVKALSKTAAERLTQTDQILFDPGEGRFYHKDTPERKVTANEITVAESSMDLLAGITLDELISFESQLFEDSFFALDHPVGKKIFEIIRNWTEFMDFDCDTYYHARMLRKGGKPFLDQEMMKAPVNISAHGRYNAIGKSCYYITDSLEGALSEIRKHSGGTKPTIQVVAIRPVKSIKLIDLSEEISGRNNFIEHLRYTVDNEEGKIIKEYLLPNFVASCCKKLGIDGIKYLSTGYCCYVMWKDDYFEFIEGSRRIVEPGIAI